MKPTPLSIGSARLSPKRIDKPFVNSAKEAVEGSKVQPGRNDAAAVLEELRDDEALPVERYEKFDDHAQSVHSHYRDLKSQWWDLRKDGKSTTEVEKKMGTEAEVLAHHQKLETELREANARAAVQAMAGTLIGVPGLLAAYSAYANGPKWTGPETAQTEAVLKETQALNAGESGMITNNNKVEQVHREELWKTMNQLLDDSIETAKAGKPTEVDLQLYELTSFEMIKKLTESAQAGNKVRLNLDAGRLDYPSRDSDGETYFSLDATPDKLRTIIQLGTTPDANIAVSLFPQKKELNSPTNLMHRKVFRVGEQVLVSGMNANLGSGENIDSGYLVRGEGATRLSENLIRDVQVSKGASLEDIWGTQHINKFDSTNLRLGQRGFISLLDVARGPSPAGTRLPKIETIEQLEELSAEAGVKFADLVELDGKDYKKEISKMLNGRYHLQLSDGGKKLLQNSITRALEVANSPENIERLDDMAPPSEKVTGTTRVDVADLPAEREALLLSAVSQADEFVYMPAFVLTRAVAAAIVARRDQVREEGKELDVRVVADAGLYPYGSNPSGYGVKFLEDHGIQPRWAKLERSGDHDRKIHAKQLITDKGEITGSTNFSTQGMRGNWETSAYVHFDESAKESKEKSVAQFEDLWENNSFELSTIDHSAFLNQDKPAVGREWFIEEGRDQSVKLILRMIGNYERESAKFHEELLESNPRIQENKEQLMAQGYSYGDSILASVRSELGETKYREALDSLKTNQTLTSLQADVAKFKKTQ